jgi:hypothetical protein
VHTETQIQEESIKAGKERPKANPATPWQAKKESQKRAFRSKAAKGKVTY